MPCCITVESTNSSAPGMFSMETANSVSRSTEVVREERKADSERDWQLLFRRAKGPFLRLAAVDKDRSVSIDFTVGNSGMAMIGSNLKTDETSQRQRGNCPCQEVRVGSVASKRRGCLRYVLEKRTDNRPRCRCEICHWSSCFETRCSANGSKNRQSGTGMLLATSPIYV